jgi:hypothetical protein
MLTQEYLKENFVYKNDTLYRIIKYTNSLRLAGSKNSRGYYNVGIKNKTFLLHRLVFLYHHGYMPQFIDHIDGDKSNNKIENLRESTISQNSCNVKITKRNTSGIKGVSFNKKSGKWHSRCYYRGKRYDLGLHDDINDAEIAVKNFRENCVGVFHNHG